MAVGSAHGSPIRRVVIVLLGCLGAFIALMGFGLAVQNAQCGCVAQGTPPWAWSLAPVLVILAGVGVIGCAAFLEFFPRPNFRSYLGVVVVVAAAVESAVVLGTSDHLIVAPNVGALVPVTAAVVVLLPLAILVLWMSDVRGRAETR